MEARSVIDMTLAGGRDDSRHVRILACLPTLRAFARVMNGEPDSADDLVRRVVLRGLEPGRLPSAAADQLLFLLTVLHDLHQDDQIARGARTIVDLYNEPDAVAGGEAGSESSSFRRIFWQLQEDDRKALILTRAVGLSLADAAIVCGCSADTVGVWVMQGRAALLSGRLPVLPAATWRAPAQAKPGVDAARLAFAACDGPQRADG